MEVRRTMSRFPKLARAAAAALFGAGLVAMAPSQAGAAPTSEPVFDWSVVNSAGNPAYTPAPILTNSNYAQVAAFLASEPPGSTLAVKIVTPINSTAAAAVFNTLHISYVFADFESSTALAQTEQLVAMIRAHGSMSQNAFVGEFNMYDVSNDGTRVGTTPTSSSTGGSFGQGAFTQQDYKAAGVNMANPAAYPGSPDFSSTPNSQNQFPNLRSAFFVLPIDRVTFATDLLAFGQYPSTTPTLSPGGFQNIPWVARFDNYGNNTLNNDPGYDGYKYVFNTTGANNPYANQLPSAGDFAAQMLQYRLRGATSFNLFNYSQPGATGTNLTYSSVIGYTVAQEQADALHGFNGDTQGYVPGSTTANPTQNSTLAAIWARPYAYANLENNVPTTNGHTYSAVGSGEVLSGIYDTTGSNRQLALMISNVSPTAKTMDLWQKYGGSSVDLNTNGSVTANDEMYTIQPGTHWLLQFNLTGDKWVLFANENIFADSNRNGMGVPEPASLGLLGLAGAGLLLRRRRPAK